MTLLEALINRGETEEYAKELIQTMRDDVYDNFRDPEVVLEEEGLEPDYVFDLLNL